VHERVAQQLLDHADSRTTREIYTHVFEKMMDDAVRAISNAVEGVIAVERRRLGPAVGPGVSQSSVAAQRGPESGSWSGGRTARYRDAINHGGVSYRTC
jgi:hypothetical protein